MPTKRKLILKPKAQKVAKIAGIILASLILILVIYIWNINDLKKLGYSEESAKKILLKFKKKEVIEIGKNRTLNKAFESEYYLEKNFNNYSKIEYQDHKNLITNINKLIKKGYSNDEISLILSRGTDSDVVEFAKRKKVKYLEEFFSISYSKLKNYDRYEKYMDEYREDEETSVLHVNLDLDKPEYEDANEITKFSYTMLVNKHNKLNEKYVPRNLIKISEEYTNEKDIKANNTALAHLKDLIDDAKKENYNIVINSAYRSYQEQDEIVNTYKELYGENYVKNYVLLAGYSEHQTGLGFDIGSRDTKVFVQSDEYKWMEKNCYKYGFIHRFRDSKEDITGIKNEAWHYRYVGKEVAKIIFEKEITLEEYHAMYIDSKN